MKKKRHVERESERGWWGCSEGGRESVSVVDTAGTQVPATKSPAMAVLPPPPSLVE